MPQILWPKLRDEKLWEQIVKSHASFLAMSSGWHQCSQLVFFGSSFPSRKPAKNVWKPWNQEVIPGNFAAKCPAMVPNQRSSHSCCAVPAVADSGRPATMAWKVRKQVGSVDISGTVPYRLQYILWMHDARYTVYMCIHLYIILCVCVCYICLHYIWNKIIIWEKYINHQTHWKHNEIHPLPTQKQHGHPPYGDHFEQLLGSMQRIFQHHGGRLCHVGTLGAQVGDCRLDKNTMPWRIYVRCVYMYVNHHVCMYFYFHNI